MINPVVSVIIPAYNTEAYIAQAIESALGQTLKNIEVIVVDDASTDKTLEIVQRFQDQRLRIIINSENMGAGGTRNQALQNSQGEWIAVLDSDDWYAPERLETLVNIAEKEKADMIADDLYLIQDQQPTPWSTLIQESGESIDSLKVIDPVYFVQTDVYGQPSLHLGISKPLFRREFLQIHQIQYDPQILVDQDFWLDLDCLVKGARFILVPAPYYFYRSRPGSLVQSSKLNRLNQYCQVTLDFLQKPEVKNNQKLVESLYHNLQVFEENRGYYRVVEPLKKGQIVAAVSAMLENPKFFQSFAQRLPSILQRRIEYYLKGNQVVYEPLYSEKQPH